MARYACQFEIRRGQRNQDGNRDIMEGIEVDNYGDEEEYEAHDDPDDDSPYVMPGDMASDPSWVKHGTDVPMEVGVNNVESFLLKKVIHEADHVVARLVKIISGKNKYPRGIHCDNPGNYGSVADPQLSRCNGKKNQRKHFRSSCQ